MPLRGLIVRTRVFVNTLEGTWVRRSLRSNLARLEDPNHHTLHGEEAGEESIQRFYASPIGLALEGLEDLIV